MFFIQMSALKVSGCDGGQQCDPGQVTEQTSCRLVLKGPQVGGARMGVLSLGYTGLTPECCGILWLLGNRANGTCRPVTGWSRVPPPYMMRERERCASDSRIGLGQAPLFHVCHFKEVQTPSLVQTPSPGPDVLPAGSLGINSIQLKAAEHTFCLSQKLQMAARWLTGVRASYFKTQLRSCPSPTSTLPRSVLSISDVQLTM